MALVEKTRSRASVWINNINKGYSHKLVFPCTNSIGEYEALLLGLHLLKDIGAKRISIQGDLDLIIRQIKGEYSSKKPRLREYRNAALDLLKTLEKYELTFIPRAQKNLANELAFVASNYKIPLVKEMFTVKVKNRPIVPNNENYWQVFEGDKHIEDFLQSENDFSLPTLSSSHEEECFDEKHTPKIKLSYIADINQFEHLYKAELFNKLDQKDLEVLQCKNDLIPRGLTPLEDIFDFNDVAKKPKMEPTKANVEEHNIGNMNELKMIKLSSTLPTHIKQEYI